MRRLPVLLLCTLLSTACAVPGPDTDPAPGAALAGRWGGAHVGLSLSPSGGGIEYDCANGVLDAPIMPDADGAFRIPGRHMRGHGGPEQVGEQLPSQPAWYEGSVAGDRMRLRVRAGTDTLGPFTLQRGADAQLLKCL